MLCIHNRGYVYYYFQLGNHKLYIIKYKTFIQRLWNKSLLIPTIIYAENGFHTKNLLYREDEGRTKEHYPKSTY